ncbi:tetratricopeptide repeat protein [Nostoc sphaeroides CHAB 2801]|uniref:tetratricopeptide repeat protein n=1 Tax=Nostoc sphaeroides TaxID=446679 RepID=UPI001E4589BD|nr:tetratricopeptide repeat protein [Nostoc sphaeroides]MCC5631375.1 tetratricopeptide repeat protein [Nostoc sphaeroides CHAB 2801]
MLQQDYKGGVADLNEALRLKPEDADVYYYRGLARILVKDNQGARQDFEKAADLYKQQGKADDYQKVMAKIRELQ